MAKFGSRPVASGHPPSASVATLQKRRHLGRSKNVSCCTGPLILCFLRVLHISPSAMELVGELKAAGHYDVRRFVKRGGFRLQGERSVFCFSRGLCSVYTSTELAPSLTTIPLSQMRRWHWHKLRGGMRKVSFALGLR